MKKRNIKQIEIQDDDVVVVVETINNVDLRYTSECPFSNASGEAKQKVKRMDQNHYLNPQSGQIKTYKRSGQRTANESTFYRTRRELNGLILNSFRGGDNELFMTLTYFKEVTDPSALSPDFTNFMRRLKRRYKNLHFDYILVKEPHASGSWHMHALLKYVCSVPNLGVSSQTPDFQAKLAEIWGLGSVHSKSVTEVNQLSSYLTNHMMHLIVDENGEEVNFQSSLKLSSKQVVKNGRLAMYPHNLKIYSYSKGFSKPTKEYMTYREFKLRYCNDYDVNWDNSFTLSNGDFAISQRHVQMTKKV